MFNMQYKTAKDIPVHLDLTGAIDAIKCKCGGVVELPFNTSKIVRKKLIVEFYKTHKECKKAR